VEVIVSTTSEAKSAAGRAGRSDVITRIGRVGLVAYGVLNLLVAFIAIKVATGGSSQEASKSGALQEVAEKPFGAALLWIMAVGLAALAIWQASEAIWGYAGAGKKRTMKRVGSAGRAVVFAAAAVSSAKFALGHGQSQSGKSTSATGKLMQEPMGRVLVIIIGLAIIGVALFIAWHGLSKRFADDLDLSRANRKAKTAAIRLGQVGYAGIGAAYVVVGALVVTAAATFDPDKASGLDGAIKTIAGEPFGAVLLWLVALGFVCYGVFCFFDARYRRS
jgi:hypothetical protein